MNNNGKEEIRVIIYGYCSATEMIIERLQPNVKVVGFSDKYSDISTFSTYTYYSLEDLNNNSINFDYIIITERYRTEALEIAKTFEQMGIEKIKIIPYFVYASFVRYRLAFEECDDEHIEGIILGNSHLFRGCDSNFISASIVNLSLTGMDIFGALETLEAAIKEYSSRLNNISFVLFDLWEYNFLNIDNSLCNDYIKKIVNFGYIAKKHNYVSNSDEAFAEELFNEQKVVINDETVKYHMKRLFGSKAVWDKEEYSYDSKKIWDIIPDYPFDGIPIAELVGGGIVNIREKTVQENVDLLTKMIELVREFKPDVKIIFTLLPRYNLAQQAVAPFLEKWEPLFNQYMNQMINNYQVIIKNYKNCYEISSERRFYYDWSHLNSVGAAYMASIIDKDLKVILQRVIK